MASEFERTTEGKAQDYIAMGHSVNLINKIRNSSDSDSDSDPDRVPNRVPLTAEELKDCVSRNVEHLEIMVALKDWGSEDMTAINAAITNGKAYLAS